MYDFITKCDYINKEKVFLLGRSLGGAVALNLIHNLDAKAKHIIKGVIIESTFTSISDMADQIFEFLQAIPMIKALILRNKWDSLSLVGKLRTPIMFISGSEDNFVPTKMTI